MFPALNIPGRHVVENAIPGNVVKSVCVSHVTRPFANHISVNRVTLSIQISSLFFLSIAAPPCRFLIRTTWVIKSSEYYLSIYKSAVIPTPVHNIQVQHGIFRYAVRRQSRTLGRHGETSVELVCRPDAPGARAGNDLPKSVSLGQTR